MMLVKNYPGSMYLCGIRHRLLRVKWRAPVLCHFFPLLLLGFVCTPLSAEQLAEHRLQDLEYGRALYQFFQNDNLGAITQLKIAEQRAGTDTQQDEANLLLADLYLDYGLYEESRELFSRLSTAENSDSLQSQAWFNLARLRYEQGDTEQALDLLSRISDQLPASLEAERKYMLSNLYLDSRQYEESANLGNQISPESIWKVYAGYNLGVSLIEDGHYEQGKQILSELGQMEAPTTELRALRDRANLSLGLKQLRIGLAEEALESIDRIRLEGPLSNQALLVSGWARYQLKQYDKALLPWRTLINRNAVDAATQEALLAVPASYAESKQDSLAVQHYEMAAKQFDLQLELLNRAIDSINSNSLIIALRDNAIQFERSSLDRLPPSSDVTPQLYALLASDEFQREIKRYQELVDISFSLGYWGNSFPALELVLEERQQHFRQQLPVLQQSTSPDQVDKLSQRRDEFVRQVDAIQAKQDYLALASSQELDHIERLHQVALSIVKVADENDTAYQQDMFRLLSGMLHYEMAIDYPIRLWKKRKQLILLDRALDQAKDRILALQRITDRTANDFLVFEQRIHGQSDRILDLQAEASSLLKQQEQHINQMAIDAIREQQLHIVQLRLSARYRLAKMYDRLAGER